MLEPVSMEKYDYIALNPQEQWVVAMSPGAPLAKLECITSEDLKGAPLILPRRLDVQSELARWFGDEFEKLNILMTANLPSNSSVMAHYKLAYAIIILGSISFWNPDKIVWRPLEPRLKASSVLAWRRKQPFGLAAEKFIKHVKEALRGGGEGI